MYDEQGNEIFQGVEILPSAEALDLADNAPVDYAANSLEKEGDLLGEDPEVPVETAVEVFEADAATPDTLSSERVEEIVDAVLESDRVTVSIDSFTYSLDALSDAVMVLATSEPEEREEQEPIVVISADELLDKLEARQAETAQATQAAVKSSPMDGQTVAAAAPAATRGGEILVPGEEELLPVEIIAQVIQAIYEHFQQDDIDTMTEIRDAVSEIKASVEPHPLIDTPFADYTVTEGLLLVAVLWFVVLNPCIRMIKGGFSWLL